MALRSARFDRLLTVLRRTTVRDDFGQEVQTYVPEANPIFATKNDTGAREFFKAGERTVEQGAVFMIRWRSDISTIDRVECEGKTYELALIREVGRKEALELTATEIKR